MTKLKFYSVIIFTLLFSCSDQDKDALDGAYSGTFYRVRNGVKEKTSNVTLNFLHNKYDGTSSLIKYPAICEGTFSVNGNEIDFQNTCAWTAEFDWTLILSGKFRVSLTENELILAKERDHLNGDFYVMRKIDAQGAL